MALSSALTLAIAATGNDLFQLLVGGLLGGGLLASVAAFRKAPAEKELTTLQGMQILLLDTRTDRDDARKERDEAIAEKEAAEAHSLFMERRCLKLEERLKRHGLDPEPPKPPAV